eukprot:GHVU01163740.1.p1 GENE.GHVU01163740.1~~GHVU01163740.1.p1  ORF type:complete len:134 (-),score=10.44 GHVU01163740.1:1420-1821(-)
MQLPQRSSDEGLARELCEYFANKIGTIRASLDLKAEALGELSQTDSSPDLDISLDSFEPSTIEEVKKIIMQSSAATCALDPIPTWLLKSCLDQLTPVITRIIKMSMEIGYLCPTLKPALVTPLLKKLHLMYCV